MIWFLGAASGCGTCWNFLDGGPFPRMFPFGGVAHDVHIAVNGYGVVEDIVNKPLSVIDLPLSLVGDVATLPVTIPYTSYAAWKDHQKKQAENWWVEPPRESNGWDELEQQNDDRNIPIQDPLDRPSAG